MLDIFKYVTPIIFIGIGLFLLFIYIMIEMWGNSFLAKIFLWVTVVLLGVLLIIIKIIN